jgi:heterodisulfide reductase subunit A
VERAEALQKEKHNVLVAGGGIAGMAAAMHLAELGIEVFLLDSAPAIGGSMHLLDHTFPTNSCGICLMLPQQPAFCPTLACEAKENLHLLPYAEIVSAQREPHGLGPGATRVTVKHKARYVDVGRCNGCGDCAPVCPEPRPHDYEGWLSPVKAIYRPPGLRAVPDAWVIDMETCSRCGACVDACPTAAIDLEMESSEEILDVSALLLAPGYSPFDARLKAEYGYGVYDNVLSALEFERMASLAGSTVAHLARPSDGQAPKRVAFVHCVGSRDNLCGAGYCSSVCCMYTAKQVALAKELDPELEATVFTMDLRAFGKDFEAYVAGVQALPGVRYLRAMPSSVYQQQRTRDLAVTYVGEEGLLLEDTFDLLVLAVGLAPPQGVQALARELGVRLNEYGFARTDGYHPTHTDQPGVFVAGAFREPKDIPETVAEAAGAAAAAAGYLAARTRAPGEEGRATDVGRQPAAGLRDVSDEEPRVGVFVCDCNAELAPVGVPELAAWAKDLPGVALAQAVKQGCSPEGQAAIAAAIDAGGLNRVVVAGCSPRLFGDEFEGLMRGVGLDPRLLARTNLREQVVYPHRGNGTGLTREALVGKARSLLGMAVASMRTMAGLEALALGDSQTLTRRALVVGGGAAGMAAALALARLDLPVDLVERGSTLGGQWRQIHYQADGSDPQAALDEMIAEVEGHHRVTVHLETEVTRSEGRAGLYRTVLATRGAEQRLEHGVLLVATGGKPAPTAEYLYGRDPRVVTQRELEEQVADGTLATVQRVVMIQCVGSREPDRPYCSRVCCTQAVKNALKLKALKPGLEVYVLYREVRTYGFRESYYEAARDAGVVFLRYQLPDKPGIRAEGDRLEVSLVEPVTGQPLLLAADLLVLSVGIEAEENGDLAGQLGVTLNAGGFFQEEHPKLKPLDLKSVNGTPGGGIFAAGLAHSPRFLEETMAQAQGAAMRAAAFLAPGVVVDRPTSVWVSERLCSFCGLCEEACPYGARVMNEDKRVADVDYALCQGCGVCAVVCPNKATLQKTLEHKQMMAAIDMAVA